MVGKFYIAKGNDKNKGSLLYTYKKDMLQGKDVYISYTLNQDNHVVYTHDLWPENILNQNHVRELYNNCHKFIKTLFIMDIKKVENKLG